MLVDNDGITFFIINLVTLQSMLSIIDAKLYFIGYFIIHVVFRKGHKFTLKIPFACACLFAFSLLQIYCFNYAIFACKYMYVHLL